MQPAQVQYDDSERSWQDFPGIVRALAEQETTRRVCEVGGGARPFLDLSDLDQMAVDYTVVDLSADELAKAPEGYRKVQADIAGDLPPDVGRFDLIFSKTLAEHVQDGERFHRNVFSLLTDGGTAVHFFPTLYAPAFLVNRLLPTAVSRWLLSQVQGSRRDDEGLEGKFPAYYRWCRGPSATQLDRLRALGYEIVEYRGYFGTHGYYRPLRLAWLDDAVTRLLQRRPVAALTSYAIVVLRRPHSPDEVSR